MSLNGKLEDVSLGDVMQFIHLGRRTGTLSLTHGLEEAEIGFHRGQIVSAWSPGSKRLGELLVEKGLLEAEMLEDLMRLQSTEQPRRSLGQILVQTQNLEFEALRRVIEEQIERTIYKLVTWTSGSFEFALDELKPIDDIAMYPGDVIPKLNLNTQRVLLEATRVYDEKQRDDDAATGIGLQPGSPESEPFAREVSADDSEEPSEEELRLGEAMSLSSVADTLEGLDVDFPIQELEGLPEPAIRRLQIVSADRRLADDVDELIPVDVAKVVRVPLREAGTRLPGEPTPTIVVLDMLNGNHSVEDLLAIRRSRPRSSVIALVDSQELTTHAFESGAVAAIPASPGAIVACFNSLIRAFQDANASGSVTGTRAGFARLRRVLADIRSGLLSATMALNLMHILSESVERAVLFLVEKECLTALGAFGFGQDGKPLAEATRNLRLDLSVNNVLTLCLNDGQLRNLTFDRGQLPAPFADVIGRPYNGQIVVFPVMGSERVISVVYTDNGTRSRAIEDIELLELATAQVGVAFENELLRRQIDRRG